MKDLRIVATAGFSEKYGEIEIMLYISIIKALFKQYPYDMFVFEMKGANKMQVRLAGYNFNTNKLDETTIVYTTESLPIKNFWFKIDDYESNYVGTFLFPEEY